MQVIRPPNQLPYGTSDYTVFLAGSIEMGVAVDWQTDLTKRFEGIDGVILNPRRIDWDSSWEQKFENVKFNEQVTWELDALDMADRILLYFDPNTKSPISLLELGLYAESKKLVVCCPQGFWRKGNVDIVCHRYEIPMVNSLDDLVERVKFDLNFDTMITDMIDNLDK